MDTDPNREMTPKEAVQALASLIVVCVLVAVVCTLLAGAV